MSCSLADLLIFASGANQMPLLGFEKPPTIIFVHNKTRILPTASTCDVELRLPTTHGKDYQKFKEVMVMALGGNDGFGGV